MTRSPVPAIRVLWLAVGFIVWSVAFVALYAVLSIGCEFGWHEMRVVWKISVQRIVLVALLGLALLAGAGVVVITCSRWMAVRDAPGTPVPPAGFLERLGYVAAVAALAATAITLGPALFLTTCY